MNKLNKSERLLLKTSPEDWCLVLANEDRLLLKSAVSWRIDGCDFSSLSPRIKGRADGGEMFFEGPGFESTWSAALDEQGQLILSMSVTNTSDQGISLETMRPIWAKLDDGNGLYMVEGNVRRPSLEDTWVLTDDWERINSWNVRCKPIEADEALISPWNIFVYEKSKKDGFFAGAIDCPITFSKFDLVWRKQKKMLEFSLEADCRLGQQGLLLEPRQTFKMERYALWYENHESPRQILQRATEMNAETLGVRKTHTDRIMGYSDWYWAYGSINEECISTNQDELIKEFGSMFNLMQMDDGWQLSREPGLDYFSIGGPWEVNSKFPKGIKAFSDNARKDALTPGVWVRPLDLDRHSELGKKHPEWYLDEESDTLDPTVPEVLDYLRETISRLVKKDGIGYLKLDYMTIDFTGESGHGKDFKAWPRDGFKHRSGTGIQVLRNVSEVIREAAGDEVFILGCNVLTYPHIDLFDGFRTGNDITAMDFEVTAEHGICALFHRAHQHGVLYHADPDCVVVSDPLTMNEARLWAGLVALSGQMFLLSEDLSTLPESRKDILRKLKPYMIQHKGGFSPDLFLDPWPRLWYLPESKTLGVFNYRNDVYRASLDLEKLGLDLPETQGVDLWSRKKTVMPSRGRLELEEVPHGTAIYQF